MSAAGGVETEDDASEAANEEERGEDEGARARYDASWTRGGLGGSHQRWFAYANAAGSRGARSPATCARRVSQHAKHISCERTGGPRGGAIVVSRARKRGRLRPRGETGRAVRSRRVVHRAAHLRRLGVVHRRGRHRADATRAGGEGGRRGGCDETGRTVTRDDDEGRPCSFEQMMLISASIVQSGSFRHPAVILCNASEFFLNLRRRSSRRSSPPPWAALITRAAGSPGKTS